MITEEEKKKEGQQQDWGRVPGWAEKNQNKKYLEKSWQGKREKNKNNDKSI